MKQFTLILALVFTAVMFGQKVKVTEGSFKNLKGISEYNLEFNYDGVMIPKYDSEEEFLADKMAKREEKNPGSGEEFKAKWFSSRERAYQPKFIESFNKRWKKDEVQVGENMSSAEYTMKIHTTLLWEGYNIGVMRKNAKMEATVSVYKNDNPSKILWSANYSKIEGGQFGGYDFDSAVRVGEAYAKLGKEVAANIKKKAK